MSSQPYAPTIHNDDRRHLVTEPKEPCKSLKRCGHNAHNESGRCTWIRCTCGWMNWQVELLDALPSGGQLTLGVDGGQFRAVWRDVRGEWSLRKGYACRWAEIEGPMILPKYQGRIVVESPDGHNGVVTRAIEILSALGAL
jgi:hypothetical protein